MQATSSDIRRGGVRSSEVQWLFIAGLVVLMLVFAAGCGGDEQGSAGVPSSEMLTELDAGEGQVNLIAWPRYVEDGSTDPDADWVSGFEKETGCEVNVKVSISAEEMVQLMRTGQYDAVSASGDATTRLIETGDVAPINTDLIPNYADVYAALKDQPFNSVNGQMYGIPQGRAANLLMYDPDEVEPEPTSWEVVFDGAGEHSGKVTAYDDPIYIADAALYLREHNPDLGITNPYELDEEQFAAAIELLKAQKEHIGEYWFDYTKAIKAFANGDSSVGTAWQVIASSLNADGSPEEVVLPEEGATGRSDTWMISSNAANPNCAYLWLDHIISPQANAAVAEWLGAAPSNERSCALTADPKHCEIYRADDEEFFDRIEFWRTPALDCGDDRGEICKTYEEWVAGWSEVKR